MVNVGLGLGMDEKSDVGLETQRGYPTALVVSIDTQSVCMCVITQNLRDHA